MKIELNNHTTFASTGGRAFDPSTNTLIFIHGSGQSHLSFMLQGRFFANRGWSVLAPDMPAHGLSDGPALTSIAQMADWHIALMDALNVKTANIIGHSQGGLIALDLAARYPDRVTGISLVACAMAIPVNDALLDMAKNREAGAIGAMTDWGHGPDGHAHDHTMPGQNHLNFGVQMMAANETGALYADLKACVDYTNGPTAAAAIKCPTQVVLAERDKMTPKKFGLKMAGALNTTDITIVPNAGHMLTTERPFEVNRALRPFFPQV
jgi:pimeloyl-ACP methyl ester carboxylesterase